MTSDDSQGITVLTDQMCWARLRTVDVGRLAFVEGRRVEIFPVNYAVDHGGLVFRSAPGTKLGGLEADEVVFEADHVDHELGRAWSVVVRGQASQILDPADLLSTVDLPLWPLGATPKPRFVRIDVAALSGREFHIVAKSRWNTAISGARTGPVE